MNERAIVLRKRDYRAPSHVVYGLLFSFHLDLAFSHSIRLVMLASEKAAHDVTKTRGLNNEHLQA